MSVEQRGPSVCSFSFNQEGKDEMTKASINLQDLRRRIYVKAKADTSWRFWGLYVHVCKMETLREAYAMAKRNDGAPGEDGLTFEAIEAQGVDAFLGQIRNELIERSYVPLPARRQEIPKDGGKVRILSIPAIRDRVAQGALKLILEPIFEADFQPGSFGYRPNRTAHEAVTRVSEAIVCQKTRIIDIDLRSYFDNVRQDRLLAKVAQRVNDADVMHLLKIMLSMVRIVGGIILMRIGFQLFSASSDNGSIIPAAGAGQDGNIAFVPLALPLMCGPGAIATILGMTTLIKHSEAEFQSFVAIALAILATMFVTYLCLAYAGKL